MCDIIYAFLSIKCIAEWTIVWVRVGWILICYQIVYQRRAKLPHHAVINTIVGPQLQWVRGEVE